MKNYYRTLGISQNASTEEIKKAYIQLAIRYHPDKNPGDNLSEQFKEINEAKQVLLNDLKKFNYDVLLVDFLANSSSKFSGAGKKRSKRIYDKTKKTLRKNRLFVTILFSITILVCAAFFQIPPDETVTDAPGAPQSIIRLEKKSLEAKTVALPSFEPNKKAVERTPIKKEANSPKPITSAGKAIKKKKIAVRFIARARAPKKRKVLMQRNSDDFKRDQVRKTKVGK